MPGLFSAIVVHKDHTYLAHIFRFVYTLNESVHMLYQYKWWAHPCLPSVLPPCGEGERCMKYVIRFNNKTNCLWDGAVSAPKACPLFDLLVECTSPEEQWWESAVWSASGIRQPLSALVRWLSAKWDAFGGTGNAENRRSVLLLSQRGW